MRIEERKCRKSIRKKRGWKKVSAGSPAPVRDSGNTFWKKPLVRYRTNYKMTMHKASDKVYGSIE